MTSSRSGSSFPGGGKNPGPFEPSFNMNSREPGSTCRSSPGIAGQPEKSFGKPEKDFKLLIGDCNSKFLHGRKDSIYFTPNLFNYKIENGNSFN